MNRTEMEARLQKLNDLATKETDRTKIKAYLEEAKDLAVKIDDAKALEELDSIAKSHTANGGASLEGGNHEDGTGAEDLAAQRGSTLLAGNSIKLEFKDAISSTTVAMPNHTSQTINEASNPVSGLIDLVNVIALPGGESYKKGFVKTYGEGGYTAEGAAAHDAEPSYGYVDITKTKITAYAEEPDEIAKLAPATYSEHTESSVSVAVRRKLSNEILIGDGASGHLTGIFHNPESPEKDVIDRDTDIEVSAIDDKTLDEIIYSYGGDEEVGGVAVLALNKLDLKAFATLRTADGKKVYNVVNHGNTGTIDTIPYVISSACKPISASSTEAGQYCMAYGNFKNYELPFFSDMEVKKSTDYKFKEGQICHKAEVFAGGNVAAFNGFVRVKKKGA